MFTNLAEAIELFGEEVILKMVQKQITHEWYKRKIADLKSKDAGQVGVEYLDMLGLTPE